MVTIIIPEKISERIFQSTIRCIKLKKNITLYDYEDDLFILKKGKMVEVK